MYREPWENQRKTPLCGPEETVQIFSSLAWGGRSYLLLGKKEPQSVVEDAQENLTHEDCPPSAWDPAPLGGMGTAALPIDWKAACQHPQQSALPSSAAAVYLGEVCLSACVRACVCVAMVVCFFPCLLGCQQCGRIKKMESMTTARAWGKVDEKGL